MKLFLASEAKHPLSMEELDGFVGGLRNKKIIYIPTAANGQYLYGSWKTESGTWQMLQEDFNVSPLVLEESEEEEVRSELEQGDIVWMAGGLCGYLMYWLRRRGVDRYIRDLLDRGLIYVGSSAGSMIAGQSLEISEWYPGKEEKGVSVIPALNLIDFDIFPHYEEGAKKVLERRYKGDKLYLLKDGEAIIVDGEEIIFTGEKRVI